MKNVQKRSAITLPSNKVLQGTRYPATAVLACLLSMFTLFSSTVHADAIVGMQAFWDFNNGGATADSSGNDRDLTLRSNPNAYGGAGSLPTVEGGGVGGGTALQLPMTVYDARMGAPGTFYGEIFGPSAFAGGDAMRADEGSGTDPFDLNSPGGYAVQTWVNFDALLLDRQQALLSKTAGFGFSSWQGWWLNAYRNGTGVDMIEFAARTGNGPMELRNTVSLVTGSWYHILVNATVTGPNMQYDLFFNGANIASVTSGGVNAVAGPLLFGHTSYAWGGVEDLWLNSLRGSLDQVAFWDRTLTQDEVADMYNGGQGFAFPSSSVPEPSSMVLILLGMMLLMFNRLFKNVGEAASARQKWPKKAQFTRSK